jgi:hypothetical protein
MKNTKIILLSLICLGFALMLGMASATTIEIRSTNDTVYRNGFVQNQSSSPSDWLPYLQVGDDTSNAFVAFLDFNTSVIPDGSIINSVSLELTRYITYGTAGSIWIIGLNQTSRKFLGPDLSYACTGAAGSQGIYNKSITMFIGSAVNSTGNITLNSNATQNLSAQLSEDWFSLCLWEPEDALYNGAETFFWANHSNLWGIPEGFVPKLIVDYTSGGADTTYPTFSNFYDTNGTIFGSGFAEFYSNVFNTNGTVFLNINGTNRTASHGGTSCYQETANASTAGDGTCGLNYTGSYQIWTLTGNGSALIDGDWNTSKYLVNLTINYTKPINATGAIWEVKQNTYPFILTSNLTIPNDCWDAYSDKIVLKIYTDFKSFIQRYAKSDCYNGTSWRNLQNISVGELANNIYEEAMIWNIASMENYTVSVPLTSGVYPYYWWAYGNGSSTLFNSTDYFYYSVLDDVTYPYFSNFWDNNGTVIGSGLAQFYVNLTNTNGNVFLNINGTNQTASYSGMNTNFSCYQETADVSTSCGGIDVFGAYYTSDDAGNQYIDDNYWYDGDWTTRTITGSQGTNATSLYVNYTKPFAITSAIWQAEFQSDSTGERYVNMTLPDTCLVNNPVELYVNLKGFMGGAGRIYFECKNDTGTFSIIGLSGYSISYLDSGNISLYEEAMIWNISVSIDNYNVSVSLANGTYPYYWWAYGSGAGALFNSTDYFYYSVLDDVTYPTFSNFWDNNGTLTDAGLAQFYVNLTNTNGNVFLNINGSDFPAYNTTAWNVYNTSVTLINGTYPYYWWSYGNGTNHNYNDTGTYRWYIVNPTNIPIPPGPSGPGSNVVGTSGGILGTIEGGIITATNAYGKWLLVIILAAIIIWLIIKDRKKKQF